MPSKLVNETIDERILRLLGLEDVFDLDYDTYDSLLREAIIKSSFGDNKIPEEELALLSNERKRVRGEKGRFKVNTDKITVDKIATTKLLRPSKSLSSDIEKISKPSIGLGGEVGKDLIVINQKLGDIIKSLTDQNNLEQKSAEQRRKTKEKEKRGKKEERLEGGLKSIKTIAQKVLSPVQGILDKIVKFILFTVLGRAFKLFMDWASDPKNKKKLESVGRFLKDWWPLLLGAWFFFANPLGRFIRTIVGTVLKLTFKIGKFAIPKLLNLIRAHPLASLIIGTSVAGTLARTGERERLQPEVQKQRESIEKTQKDPDAPWYQKLGSMFAGQQLSMGQGQAIVAPVPGAMYNRGGSISGYSGGASIFSGEVTGRDGTTVSGAGPDTQFFPVEGGGGAVLQKGESVLQVGARERMIEEHGVDPLAYNVGSNANKPRPVRNNIFARAYGGIIDAFSGGGEIGIAANHLKQDEALSSLRPGINEFTRPGSSNWSKVNKNTPIYSYLDSVGQATIGWGSTYYDSILNGKKPVRMGDKISKGKADDILSANISNLAKEYSSKIPHWSKMTEKQKAGLLLLGYNAPYGPIGAYPNLTKALQGGDIRSAAQNMQRGGPNPQRIALERNLLMSGPLNLKNLKGPKIVGEKIVGSGIPFVPPFMHNPNQMQRKQKGGIIKESDGSDYGPDGNRLEGADRQFFSYFAQPGESRFIFTKTATERGAVGLAELIQARLDPNSNAAMKGKYTLPPPSSKGKSQFQVLPPIDSSSGLSKNQSVGRPASTVVPSFSVIATSAYDNRMKIAKTYGIV